MIQFKRTEYDIEEGQTTGVAPDGTIITRVETSPHCPGKPLGAIVFYKMDRPDIDKRRVRLRWEEICKYGLAEHGVYALDQHGNMFWVQQRDGKLQVDVLEHIGTDKDGFPLYPQETEEILHPNMYQASGRRKIFHN